MKYFIAFMAICIVGFVVVYLTFSSYADKVIDEAQANTEQSYIISATVEDNSLTLTSDGDFNKLQDTESALHFQNAANLYYIEKPESLLVQ